MALVDRKAQAMEGRVDREMAAECSNYQQLLLMKKRRAENREMPPTPEGLTPSERLLWYRSATGQEATQLDKERCAQSSNYRQLMLARGFRSVQESEEERAARPATRSESLLWYRSGGREALEAEAVTLSNCANWQQYSLMTRGRAEPRDPEQEITRSERLHWYRYGGGEELVEERAQLCRDSGNYMQYKLARDTKQHANNLESSMNRHWSNFRSKEELSDHLTQLRLEGVQEREEVRSDVRRQVTSMASVAKQCYEAHMEVQWEEESVRQAAREVSREERVEQLRRVTEEMLTSRNEYAESTRSLALKATREDAAAVSSSRSVRRTQTVVSVGA